MLFAALLALAVAGAYPAAQPRAPQAPASAFPCDVQTTERIVAVGDVHGAFDQFVAILRVAGIIDNRNRWSGKKAVLVQTGDVLDRGPDSRKALDLLRKLEGEAQRAGGRVYALLGNHELMRLVSDWRYVSQGETDAFRNADSVDLRERAFTVFSTEAEKSAKAVGKPFDPAAYREAFMKEIPARQPRDAVRVRGERRVRRVGASARRRRAHQRHPVPARRYQRAGVDDGLRRINAAVRKDLLSLPVPLEQVVALLGQRNRSALVSRSRQRARSVARADARRHPRAHEGARDRDRPHHRVPGKITPRLGGRVILIDTGMVNGEFYPGGVASALELQGDKATAIYLDRREPLAGWWVLACRCNASVWC